MITAFFFCFNDQSELGGPLAPGGEAMKGINDEGRGIYLSQPYCIT